MAWDPTQPVNGAALQSAPMRGNFAALDTTLMAPVTAAPAQALVYKGAGAAVAGLPIGTNGHVLTVVSGAPAWAAPSGGVSWPLLPPSDNTSDIGSAALSIRDLYLDRNFLLAGGAVGTSGVGVFALGPGTAPTTSPLDTVQLYTEDLVSEAGSRVLVIRDERGSTFEIGGTSGTYTGITMARSGAATATMYVTGGGAFFGTDTAHGTYLYAGGVNRLSVDITNQFYLAVAGVALRNVSTGALDSGGAGYRQLIIAN